MLVALLSLPMAAYDLPPNSLFRETNTYLVTGAAGFIGMHTSLRLLARGNHVMGIDNINDYYDVTLKEARLEEAFFLQVTLQRFEEERRRLLNPVARHEDLNDAVGINETSAFVSR